MMLFGHSQDLERAMPLIRRSRPAYWKCIDPDPAAAAECAALGVNLIIRHNGPWDQNADLFHAVDFYSACQRQPWFPFAWAVETPNEPYPGRDVPPGFIDQEALLVTLLWTAGKGCVAGNRGTGHDGHFVPGATLYGAHEYGWPDMLSQAPWQALRYRSWFPAVLEQRPDARLLITECGVTQGVTGGPDIGWQSDGRTAEQFIAGSLAPYAAELRRDRYVLGAAVFQAGGHADWSSFECLGTPVEDWMATQEAPQPSVRDFERWGRVMPEFRWGFLELANKHGAAVVGEPVTDEKYLGGEFSYQFTTKGVMLHDKSGDRHTSLFLPARM